jgi:DNA-binding response OmpR family regulator
LTAKDSIQDKEEGYGCGADSYLTKPFSAKLLKAHNQHKAKKSMPH